MGKKSRKKPKKISAKKEKYLKFRKEKSASIDISMPELSEEQLKRKREDEEIISRFRFGGNPPSKEIVKRKEKSKR